MKISIIIPTHNRLDKLKELTNLLFQQKYTDKNLEIDIIVIEDGCTDGTKEYLLKSRQIKYISGNGNWWFTKSVNEGIRVALKNSIDFILILNDDLIIPDNYIQKLLDSYKMIDDVAILGSLTLTFEQPHRIFFSGVKDVNFNTYSFENYYPFMQKADDVNLKGLKSSFTLPGRGMLIPSKILCQIGILDETFIQYGADTEFCYRALRNNFKICISYEALIYSHWKETGKGSPFLKQNGFGYLRNVLINKYSARFLGNDIKLIKMYFNRSNTVILIIKAFVGKFTSYIKYRKCRQ